MNLAESVKVCFSKYAVFKGRASRSEYWWFFLFNMLVVYAIMLIELFALGLSTMGMISNVASLVFLLPQLAAFVRRLHDTGRSGWWYFLCLTIIGIIPLIIWLASEGSNEPNEYGDPINLN